MKTYRYSVLTASIMLAVSAQGGVLWTTTFNGTDGNTRNLVNTNTTLTDILTADDANLTFQDTSFSGTVFMHAGTMGAGNYFSPRTNVDNPAAATPQNGGWWQSEFRYTGGTEVISLESVVFDIVWSNSSGNLQAGDASVRDILLTAEYSLDSGGLWSPLAAAQTYNLTVNPGTIEQQHQDRNFTLGSALPIDHGNQDLWIRVKAENAGATAGGYVNIRDITFNGTVVPEPSAALLSGLILPALLRRRRK